MAVGIVLAGRRNKGALRAAEPTCEWEALIPIAGRAMGAYVVAALSGARDVERVIVAGPETLAQSGAVVVPPGERVTDSLAAALAAARAGGDAHEIVIAAGDTPLLSADTVTHLIDQSRLRGLALGYPIVSRRTCEARFPGMRRTYVRVREGIFTGGNCFYLRGEAIDAALALLERVHAHRKHPLRLACLFGWGVVAGVLCGTAQLQHLELAASRLLGRRAGVWISPDVGVGVDVDRPSDLDLCRAVLGAAPHPGPQQWPRTQV